MDELVDSRLLHVFVSVAKAGNMRKAARQLHLTPSAISHGLKAFEEMMGCRLFERTTRSLVLSNEGAQLLPEAELVLASLQNLRGLAHKARDWRRGRLRIGASPTACQYLVPSVIREFKESFPEVSILITQGAATVIAQELHEGSIDIGLSPRTTEHRGLGCVDVAEDALAFIVHPMHSWARAGRVERAAIATQRFVLAESRSFTKGLIDDFFRREQIAITPFIEIANEEVIKELVRLDLGVGISPAWIAAEEIEKGLLVALPLGKNPPTRQWVVSHRAGRTLSFSETLFVGITRLVGANRIRTATA